MSGPNVPGTATAAADSLINDAGAALDEGRLPLRVFNDPDIHELELERIFGTSWLFVGHVSEIPEPGDYARRYLGQDPFIFIRDEDGEIQVLFDSCRHRGVELCRSEQGNTSHFRCPYHGWTYNNSGDLVGVPEMERAYGDLDRDEWGLWAAPRTATYNGLVFASLAEDGPTLEEHLGDFTWYLDMELDLSPGGMEVIGEPHRWQVDTNWKIGAENFAGDDYHTVTTHQSALEVGFMQPEWARLLQGRGERRRQIQCDGHSTTIGMIKGDHAPFFGYPEELKAHFSADRLSAEQFDIARRSIVHVGTVFPNLSFIHASGETANARGGFLSLRQWQPKAPGKMEIWSWILAPAEASPDLQQQLFDVGMSKFSTSGNFEQDDTAVWEGLATAAGSSFTKQSKLETNYRMGIDGSNETERLDDWPGPGTAWDSHLQDAFARGFHRNWHEAMAGSNDP